MELEIEDKQKRIAEDVMKEFHRSAAHRKFWRYMMRRGKRLVKVCLLGKEEYPIGDPYFFWINGLWAGCILESGMPGGIKMLTSYYDRLLFL